jgi:hypothetical protein
MAQSSAQESRPNFGILFLVRCQHIYGTFVIMALFLAVSPSPLLLLHFSANFGSPQYSPFPLHRKYPESRRRQQKMLA